MIRGLSKVVIKDIKRNASVSTWSPLATAFNTKSKKFKLDLSRKECGLFGIPELNNAQGFSILKDRAISDTNQLIEEAISDGRKRKMVEIFDEMSDVLCKVADLAEFVRMTHPDKRFSSAAEDACATVSCMVEQLNTHGELYTVLKHVVNQGDIQKLTDIDNHVLKLFLFDFEQCGIHLPDSQRKVVVDINDYILHVGQKFMAGAFEPRTIKLSELPKEARHSFSETDKEVVVHGMLAESDNPFTRESGYRMYLYPDKQQEHLLEELLNSRFDLAQICGFSTYAHRAIKGSTVETPEVVCNFLNILTDELRDRAREDFDIMQQMKNAEILEKQDLMIWDTAYYTAKAKNSWLNLPNAELAPYFSLGACMDGINILTQSLYGVRLESESVLPGEVWAENVYKLAVIDENNVTLGHIYCDLYSRVGKQNQDSHFTIKGGRQLPDGSYQNPIVVMMLSLPPPTWSKPSLLAPQFVDNLFHEMGHALHSMLGRTQYQHVTGTRCSTDFAEVPSILMEYFASDPRVVSKFAKHYKTQEPIPEPLLQKFCVTKHVFPASELQNQVFYSMLDQVYHSNKLERSSTEILADIQGKYYGLPYVENTAWQLRFSHLVGYGAKYYSYLISRAIASWIWQTYFQADPFSRSAGQKYRMECLAHGGGKPASKLVSDFLGKEANASNFAKALISEIDIDRENAREMRKALNLKAL
ncbi:mitochondrial intermediate peptidase [Orussus abietinus]|uniref:mitochondrial intermediate peptidase n=1 Tax=Orussus abietinus TaxID=222816 RepID=UPI000625A49B|nr:mitochondrial intermediate peptidase [Orussus abietinus]